MVYGGRPPFTTMMMRPATKTDGSLERALAAHAGDPERAELIARVRRFKASWFELGESLSQVKRSERYRDWGYATFEDYCRKELHLRRDTAEKLTGSFAFLRARAPEVLRRDGSEAPIPSYQAVDFWRRAEEADAPADTVQEIRHHVLDEGTPLPRLSRMYREVVFPLDADEQADKRRADLKHAVAKLVELIAIAKDAGTLPAALCAEVEEPLSRLSAQLE
jgi:hypothetical protein